MDTPIWHPFTQVQTANPPIFIQRGEGIYLYSADGSRYLDGISSWCVNLHGHAHPYITQQLQNQASILEHVIFSDFTHAPAIELASKLLGLLPGRFSKVFYSDNGSTAVEVALKMALQYWYNLKQNRFKIISLKHSYHGETFGAMSAAGRNGFNRPFWSQLFPVETIDPPLKGHEEASLLQLQKLLRQGDVACFLFEPLLLGIGGMLIYPPEGLDQLIACCKAANVLTIADEVLTGFGRTGPLFASGQLKNTPDLICLAKGLTGGFLPLAATVCTSEIFNAFLGDSLSQSLLHGHSYSGNPLACCCALASLDLLLETSCLQQREMIHTSHNTFCQQWRGHPKLKRCEILGTILVLEYASDSTSYFHSMRDRLHPFFLHHKILLRPLGNVLYVMPPYCIQKNELQHIYDHIILTLEGDL